MEPKPNLFLSHAGEDSAAAKDLANRLRQAGLEVWLDVDELKPGDRWMEALEQALARATAFAVCVGRSGIQRWVDREVRVALDRNTRDHSFRIIPILGPGSAPESLPAFLSHHQWLDLRQGVREPSELQQLVGAILEKEPAVVSLLPADQPPFRGLFVFDVEHAHLFFGRDRETEELLERLRADPFLAVVGDSGSGKSSLVRAGLVPALHRGRFYDGTAWVKSWRVAICRPGDDPFRELANALPDLDLELTPEKRIAVLAQCREQLKQGKEGLYNCLAALVRSGVRTLLIVDQFEELFTLTIESEERRRFVDSLLNAQGGVGDRPVHVLITLRADFYSRCWEHPELPKRIAGNQYAVRRMDRAQLKEAIEKPLAMAGARLEPGLTDVILNDVGDEPGNLPLLEHALEQLWERRSDQTLTHRAYNEIGRVSGAIKHQADEVYQRFDEREKELARKIFLRLTQPGEGTEDTRRRASKSEILALGGDREMAERVLVRLADTRLVTTGGETPGEDDVVEVAHEALIREWPRLRGWVEADREEILFERRLTNAVAEWKKHGQDHSYLYHGARLA
jgi:hypothetical protein